MKSKLLLLVALGAFTTSCISISATSQRTVTSEEEYTPVDEDVDPDFFQIHIK
ncbi:MAG: hypothetical protein AAF611_14570 [Bacteroidota bacterium]